jgi:hypothetical protein
MKQLRFVFAIGLFVLALCGAGCGGSTSPSGSTKPAELKPKPGEGKVALVAADQAK